MPEDFQFPGIVPFCIETQKTVTQVNNEIMAGQPYVGSFYPIGLDLNTFSKLYWRMKEISWSYTSSDNHSICGGGNSIQYSANILGNNKNLLLKWSENPPNDPLDSLKKRSCNSHLWDIKTPFTYSGTDGTSWTADLISSIFHNYYNAPKAIAEFNGGDRNNMNNYTYYPFFYFTLIGGYGLNWSTLKIIGVGNCAQASAGNQTINLQVDGQNVSTFKMNRTDLPLNCVGRCNRTYTVTFGNFNIHLWDKPTITQT